MRYSPHFLAFLTSPLALSPSSFWAIFPCYFLSIPFSNIQLSMGFFCSSICIINWGFFSSNLSIYSLGISLFAIKLWALFDQISHHFESFPFAVPQESSFAQLFKKFDKGIVFSLIFSSCIKGFLLNTFSLLSLSFCLLWTY